MESQEAQASFFPPEDSVIQTEDSEALNHRRIWSAYLFQAADGRRNII